MSFDPVKTLPIDTNLVIFSYLNKSDIANCSPASSTWNLAANDPELWKEIAKKMFTPHSLNVLCTKDFLKKFTHQNLKSNGEIVQRIQDFLDKIQAGQKGRFTCFLGRGSEYETISVEILPRKVMLTDDGFRRSGDPEWQVNNYEFDIEKDYFSLN